MSSLAARDDAHRETIELLRAEAVRGVFMLSSGRSITMRFPWQASKAAELVNVKAQFHRFAELRKAEVLAAQAEAAELRQRVLDATVQAVRDTGEGEDAMPWCTRALGSCRQSRRRRARMRFPSCSPLTPPR